MHYSLCDTITDIVQNSIEANASLVEVELTETENKLIVYVRDNGCGMSAEDVKNARNPFYTDGVKHPKRKIGLGIPFLIVGNAFSNIIRSEGQANIAMAGMIIGNVINIVLDPVMIIGFKWNVAGAAIATVLGNVFSAVFYIVHVLSKRSLLSISIKDYTLESGVWKGVFAIGIPVTLDIIGTVLEARGLTSIT